MSATPEFDRIQVDWFPGDDEYVSGAETPDLDPPGWVPFVLWRDRSLSYPAGLGVPFREKAHAEVAGGWVSFEATYSGPPFYAWRMPRDGRTFIHPQATALDDLRDRLDALEVGMVEQADLDRLESRVDDLEGMAP